MKKVKEYGQLTFADDFLFCKILENNEDICVELLELILNKKIRKVAYLSKQKTFDVTSDGKGVRLDVYLEDDENTVFDIEMQTTASRNIPKRSRYYQGMIDLNLIDKGADYNELKKSYIIFICISNPFADKKRHLYTFENRCNEDLSFVLGDEAYKVVLTPEGENEDISEGLREFLNFLAGRGGKSSFVKKLEAAVEKARRQEEWRVEYMTLLMRDREKFAEGKAEGKAESDALWLEALTPLIKKDNAVAEAVAASMGITVEKLMQLIL